MSSEEYSKELDEILIDFYGVIFKILKICKKIEPDNIEIETLIKKIGLAREIDPLLIINKCKDKLWCYRDQIIEKNSDFFLRNKFSKFIKNDENKNYMYTIVNLVKKKYKELQDEEREYIWKLSSKMLSAAIRYKQLIQDFD